MSFQYDFEIAWQKHQLLTRDVCPEDADREDTARRWYTKGRLTSETLFAQACELTRHWYVLGDKSIKPDLFERAEDFLRKNWQL